MSEAQKAGARQRWQECAMAAEALGCGKTHVHDRLYSRMKVENLLQRVVDGDAGAVEIVKAWPEFEEVRPTIFQPERRVGPRGMELVKLAAWFIQKCGGVDKARRALDFATRVDEEMG